MDRLTKAFIVVAAVGVAIAILHGYDEITAYSTPISRVCNINNFFSCGSVFASGDVTFPPGEYGIPLYIYGLIWFPLMVALGVWYGRKRGSLYGEVMVPVLMVGNMFTFYLWYLELGVIHAVCPVCISMYVLNYVMTGLAFWRLFEPT
ncbi:MAG: hypothetical protein JRN34_05185 [Nitrososphaerota archaeon]|jgi:uncharacterized membrane protein|nr:hypothetical protein [Nitrososphaerota archaeon]MDG6942303.1 hypothetical protein [Nitrososphaerota archaeon]MDG6942768.1 hypothetical protein [Nitrososphaerota archaeon]MDG6948555.1 hypothetical protein [Nitrososphaerota archaeon]MDG6950481.1 hypothetical protein [Nitrososphaerota archaeon]